MPKIIENVREMLLAEARRQISEKGYSSVTVRSVAGACGLGVGTVYNYFQSKDVLIASFMLEDWQGCMDTMQDCVKSASEPGQVLRCIYDELQKFLMDHQSLFADPQAEKVFSTVFSDRHKQLRDQIAVLIQPICNESSIKAGNLAGSPGFLAEFIAEALLTWTVAGKSYEEIAGILCKLLK